MKDNCFYILKNLIQNSGGVLGDLKIEVEPVQGFNFEDNSTVIGNVKGLHIKPYLVDPRCFECVNENSINSEFSPGLWTTAVETEISKTVGGVTYYWVSTSTDAKGNGLFVNLYASCEMTQTLSLVEERIPIYPSGQFVSHKDNFVGNKVVVVYKLTVDSLTPLYMYNQSRDFLPRYQWKTEIMSNDETDISSLEDVAIGLLYMIKSDYTVKEPNTIKKLDKCDTDSFLKSNVQSITDTILGFVDYYSENSRYGSIPHYLRTYSRVNQVYNDSYYLDEYISFLGKAANQIAYQTFTLDWKVDYEDNKHSVVSKVSLPTYSISAATETEIDHFTFYGQLTTARYSVKLEEGQQYKIQVQGVINDGVDTVDPCYYSVTGDFSDATVNSPTSGKGLFIDNIGFFSGNESYNDNHLYTKQIVGNGEPLVFSWYENNEFNVDNNIDNSGSYEVTIHKLSYVLTVSDSEDVLSEETVYNNNIEVNSYTTVSYYRNNCLEDGCYEIVLNDKQTSREVLNASVAWFLIFLCEYSVQYDEDYTDEIEVLSNYLANQITKDKLITKGWTHNNVLAMSEVITELDLYTNVITMIAFATSYATSYNTHYLYLAATVNTGIIDQFYSEGRLINKLDTTDVVASLLYGYSMERRDIIENTLDYVKPRLNTTLLTDTPNGNNLLTLSREDKTKDALLLDLLIDLPSIDEYKQQITSNFTEHVTFSAAARCLSYINITEQLNIPHQEIKVTNNYQQYLFNFVKELPIDFGWFSVEALLNGNIAQMLRSVFNLLAALFGRSFTDKRAKLRSEQLPYKLTELENTSEMKKLKGMSLKQYKQLLFYYIEEGSTKKISKLLNWFFVDNAISTVADRLAVLNNIDTIGQLKVGEAYIQGADRFMNNSFEIETTNHVRRPIFQLIAKQISAGYQWLLIEKLFSAHNVYSDDEDTVFNITVKEKTSVRQQLSDCGYTTEQIDEFFSDVVNYLLDMDYTTEEVQQLRWDISPEINNVCTQLINVLP